jgi:hypothetical protein
MILCALNMESSAALQREKKKAEARRGCDKKAPNS